MTSTRPPPKRPPPPLPRAFLLRLQTTVGNRAVQRVLARRGSASPRREREPGSHTEES
jgi:hypothetical protein